MKVSINKYKHLLSESTTQHVFKKVLITLAREYHFEYVTYNIQITHAFDKTEYFAISSYPQKWLEQYQSNNYASIDPVIKYCTNNDKAIFWHDTYNVKASQNRIAFFQHAKEFGLLDGIGIGIKINENQIGVLSFSKNHTILQDDAQALEAKCILELLLPSIHETMMRVSKDLLKTITPSLTHRENEVLFHLAKGHTSTEVSKSLNISEATVVFHAKNIIEKVDAKNRTHAVAKAIALHLINFDKFKNDDSSYFY
jgi:DNA-binding CsgD family transcriptional regulator